MNAPYSTYWRDPLQQGFTSKRNPAEPIIIEDDDDDSPPAQPSRTLVHTNKKPNNSRQKHAATFQCTLCPKRFTRAFTLRNHLRVHTDERPFQCTVCGKPFARQHDRKTHEALHTGEKKFVCRGELRDGGSWGCGRRFNRVTNLGRHFYSQRGKRCIRPLMEEEAAETLRQEGGAGSDRVEPPPPSPHQELRIKALRDDILRINEALGIVTPRPGAAAPPSASVQTQDPKRRAVEKPRPRPADDSEEEEHPIQDIFPLSSAMVWM